MTIIELIAVLLLVAATVAAVLGSLLLLGLVVAVCGLTKLLVWFDSWRFPEVPPCRTGRCTAATGYEVRHADHAAGIQFVCRCGDIYLLTPRRLRGGRSFKRILSAPEAEHARTHLARTAPYLAHRQFSRWQPDV